MQNENQVLVNSPLFSSMSEFEFGAVTAFLEKRRLQTGEIIFHEGDAGKEMFVLCSGSLSASKRQSDGTERTMFTIAPGSFFGEMSIIAEEPRSATIRATVDSELMVLEAVYFFRLVFDYPELGLKLLNSINEVQSQWLNQNSKYLFDLVQWGDKARKRAITDELTSLYNRNYLDETIRDSFKKGAVGMRKLSLIMMDLDKVHEINNKYGNSGGDRVIIEVANVIRSLCRPLDIAARLSGDEFAVLLPDTGTRKAAAIAEIIRQNVSDRTIPIQQLGTNIIDSLQVCTSLGIASAPEHANNAHDLLYFADMALHQAKEKGRNRVELYKQF
jgi:diguanylate cyclase (GGDEF)-like protein